METHMHYASLKLLLEHRHSPEKRVLTVTHKTLAEILREILAIQSANVEIAPHYEISLNSLCGILAQLNRNHAIEHHPLTAQDLETEYCILTASVLSNADKIKNGTWCVDTFWLWDRRDSLDMAQHQASPAVSNEVHAVLTQSTNAQQWI